jgi:hypothetical protein
MGATMRNTALNVTDINGARFRPAQRDSSEYKGHPGGPRVPSPVKPRHAAADMDNSLRLFDIEGSRCVEGDAAWHCPGQAAEAAAAAADAIAACVRQAVH